MARRYDSSTTTFSPEGRLHQVEYAIEAINNAGTSVGILAKDGIVMASEKKITSGLLAQARVSFVFMWHPPSHRLLILSFVNDVRSVDVLEMRWRRVDACIMIFDISNLLRSFVRFNSGPNLDEKQ
jgi:hypothetical protein